jgi:hypothetical protein
LATLSIDQEKQREALKVEESKGINFQVSQGKDLTGNSKF